MDLSWFQDWVVSVCDYFGVQNVQVVYVATGVIIGGGTLMVIRAAIQIVFGIIAAVFSILQQYD